MFHFYPFLFGRGFRLTALVIGDVGELWMHKRSAHVLRDQKRGQDKDPEKGLFGKTTPMKLINFPYNQENRVFPKKSDFDSGRSLDG